MMDPRTQHAMQQMVQVRVSGQCWIAVHGFPACTALLCMHHGIGHCCQPGSAVANAASLLPRNPNSWPRLGPPHPQAMQELQSTGLFPQLPAGLGGSGLGPAGAGAGTGGGAGAAPPNMDALMGLLGGGAGGLGGLGGLGAFGMPPPPANPEEAYSAQLQQLQVGACKRGAAVAGWGVLVTTAGGGRARLPQWNQASEAATHPCQLMVAWLRRCSIAMIAGAAQLP